MIWLADAAATLPEGPPEWMTPFSIRHILVVGACVAAMWTVLRAGQRAVRADREPAYRRHVAVFCMMFFVGYHAYWLSPAKFAWGKSLPFHLCDVTMIVAIVSLLVPHRVPAALVYFWGIGLSSQAFFSPVELSGPLTLVFWSFWVSHSIIVGTGLYHVTVLGLRPTWVDLLRSLGIGVFYFSLVWQLNILFGFNYAYVGQTDDQPGIVLLLGSWPGRVLWMALLGAVALTLVYLPWPVARRLGLAWASDRSDRLANP